MMSESSAASQRRIVCPHCEESFALRTFREHARLYCDAEAHTWNKRRRTDIDDDDPDLTAELDEASVKLDIIMTNPCY